MRTHLLHGQQTMSRRQSAICTVSANPQPTLQMFRTSMAETQHACSCQTCAAHQSRNEGNSSKDRSETIMIAGLFNDHTYVSLQVGSDAKSDPNYFRCVFAVVLNLKAS